MESTSASWHSEVREAHRLAERGAEGKILLTL
jgi:hypothetical protein